MSTRQTLKFCRDCQHKAARFCRRLRNAESRMDLVKGDVGGELLLLEQERNRFMFRDLLPWLQPRCGPEGRYFTPRSVA
jgi:hypothetical protein